MNTPRPCSLFPVMLFLLAPLGFLSCNRQPEAQQEKETSTTAGIQLETIATGLSGPVAMGSPADGTGRLFVCEQAGIIKIIQNGKLLDRPFLDLREVMEEVGRGYSEKGLLGIAFDPQYKTTQTFFVYYSAVDDNPSSDHKSIVARFKASADPNIADLSTQQVILHIPQPESNHNGGQLAFGPDGFLYVGLGDGGGGGDRHGSIGNGQDLSTWLGKILRIDIKGTRPYFIPPDNPFANDPAAKPEIWAYGLRNPWRFSFDRQTGQLFCADVGQNAWEEIDIIEKGKNYGWRIMEANHCYDPSANCNQQGLEKPIAEYSHDIGISVTGGFVYRGKEIPSLQGKYIFADWTGKMFYLEKNKEEGDTWERHSLTIGGRKGNDIEENINSFGEDEAGELYILAQRSTGALEANGSVYRIIPSLDPLAEQR